MPVFSVYSPVSRNDYSIHPFTVHKEYDIDSGSYSALGYTIREGRYYKRTTPVSSSKANNDPKNSDGSYMHIIHKSINHLYYRYSNSFKENLEVPSAEFTDRYLFLTASIIAAPYYDIGEGIKKNTVTLEDLDQSITLVDDGLGNIYDSGISTSSFSSNDNLSLYLRFDDLHSQLKTGYGTVVSGSFKFISNTFEPDSQAEVRNVKTEQGIESGSNVYGLSTYFSSSYIKVDNREEISFNSQDNFGVSFWIKISGSDYINSNGQYVVSKKGTLQKLKYGDYQDYNEAGELVNKRGLYPVTEDVNTTVYPFSIKINSSGSDYGKVVCERSDGSTYLSLTSTTAINDNEFHHVSFIKSGSLLSLYVDGTVETSGSDLSGEVFNYHDLIFGSLNTKKENSLIGNIFDFRLYNTYLDSSTVSSLSDNSSISFRQNSNVGNIFYKNGTIVITSPDSKYHSIIDNNFNLNFKNTVTHYEIETVCKINKESFNFTFNPSSLSNYKAGTYLSEMVSGSLRPYATTIGLYNFKNELIAVGKLGSPLKIRDDVDLNVIVRFDY